MPVSAITRELAEAVISVSSDATPRRRLLLEQLRLLPLYTTIGNVAIWDKAYHAATPFEDAVSENGKLIQAIYGCATDPFYGAFQANQACRVYESTCRYLREAGIGCPTVKELTDI